MGGGLVRDLWRFTLRFLLFFPFFPLSERTPHQIFTPDMKGCFIQARFQEIEKTAVSKVELPSFNKVLRESSAIC